jgi:ferritin-like metal-binding protein YciE
MRVSNGNLRTAERWLSLAGGLAIALAAFSRRSTASRALAAVSGLTLVARGATGHCAIKAALTGESSFREGVSNQWSHLKAGLGMSAAREISTIEELYEAELQELRSAESQLAMMLSDVSVGLQDSQLRTLLQGYATELRSRVADLARIVSARGKDPRAHPDQAMRALIDETRKMTQVCAPAVRDAAVIASIQRLLHFKIAGYGTVATYAKLIGLLDEAARFAEHSDRDKAMDQQLTDIAQNTVNPRAEGQAASQVPLGSQTH